MAAKITPRLRVRWAIVAVAAVVVVTYINLTRHLLDRSMGNDDSSVASIGSWFPSNNSLKSKPLLLQVPYYVYDTGTLNWENFTFQQEGPEYADSKHSDDLWLYRASLQHPMRTKDPSKAKLFFVPFFLNAVAERRTCLHLNSTWERCFARPAAGYRFAEKHLGLSEYFQRSHGKDHVVILSHWLGPPRNIPNLLHCNLINFEGHLPVPSSDNVSAIPNFYVGKPCQPLDDKWMISKTHDFTMVATMKPGNPDFSSREDICHWLQSGTYSVSNCGFGDQCPALAQAKYGFHPRGDTWGSNRVIDLLLSRTIPLFTDPRQYDLLPPFVPWRDLTYLVNVSTRQAFEQSLKSIQSRPASDYQKKRRLIEDYMYLFDHRQIYQFDAYLAKFATRLSLQ
jgi:hypothetical protein